MVLLGEIVKHLINHHMSPQLLNIAYYMTERGRIVRYSPAATLPTVEVRVQTERLINALWDFAACVGMNIGEKPTITPTGAAISFPPVTLARLCELEVEVLATTHMLGLGGAMGRGLYEVTRNPSATPTNFKTIVDETWPDDSDDDAPEHTD